MRLWIIGLALSLGFPAVAAGQGATTTSPVELAQRAETLRPGQWVWAPAIAPSGPVLVYVDLSRQVATIYRNGVRIGVTTISSGKEGHETPTGVFTILQKDRNHHSSTYDNAPMPYQERLTWDGVALHAGGLPGYPESHGCVHLPMEFARLLFATTHMGGTVVMAGEAGKPVLAHGGEVFAGAADQTALRQGEDFRWTPEASPTGPISIIISRPSQRILVLRNGVEIGRARAVIDSAGDFATHVLTLAADAHGPRRWVFVDVPGHADEQGLSLDASVASRITMPEVFRRQVEAALEPGASILVTSAPLDSGGSGHRMTLIDAIGAHQ